MNDQRVIRVDLDPSEVLTDMTIILDRSGSMDKIKGDIIGGFNGFIKEQQRVEGRANVTLIQFDDSSYSDWYNVIHSSSDIQVIRLLTEETFRPRGMTSLLDAIGKSITEAIERIDNLKEINKPQKVIFVIITDGLENNSRNFSRDQIFELISGRKEHNWEFVFLAANQDAIGEGGRIGIGADQTMAYAAAGPFVGSAMRGVSQSMTSYRTGNAGETYSFTADAKAEQASSGDRFTQNQAIDDNNAKDSPNEDNV